MTPKQQAVIDAAKAYRQAKLELFSAIAELESEEAEASAATAAVRRALWCTGDEGEALPGVKE